MLANNILKRDKKKRKQIKMPCEITKYNLRPTKSTSCKLIYHKYLTNLLQKNHAHPNLNLNIHFIKTLKLPLLNHHSNYNIT